MILLISLSLVAIIGVISYKLLKKNGELATIKAYVKTLEDKVTEYEADVKHVVVSELDTVKADVTTDVKSTEA